MFKRPSLLKIMLLVLMVLGAVLSNTVLFSQSIKSDTDLTRTLAPTLGPWQLFDEYAASEAEYRGLETRDITKRTYTDGESMIELVVAYIPESNRKSAHAQESCLRGSGALVGSISKRNLTRAPVQATVISIEQSTNKSWVFYWFKFGSEHSSAYLKANLKMFLKGLKGGKKNQGASLVRLLSPQRRGESPEKVQQRLEDFASYLVPELDKRLP